MFTPSLDGVSQDDTSTKQHIQRVDMAKLFVLWFPVDLMREVRVGTVGTSSSLAPTACRKVGGGGARKGMHWW